MEQKTGNSTLFQKGDDPSFRRINNLEGYVIIGYCNGLFCLYRLEHRGAWFRFWNPLTRTISEEFGPFVHFGFSKEESVPFVFYDYHFDFAFGYDSVTDTYKVVASGLTSRDLIVLSLGKGNNSMPRTIESFPGIPLPIRKTYNRAWEWQWQWQWQWEWEYRGVYLNGTLNWLTICRKCKRDPSYGDRWYDPRSFAVEELVIVSLDLHTETFRQLRLPWGFDKVTCVEPIVSVLMGCLFFSHDIKETHFVLWKMTEFGVEESWTQFLKISYVDLQPFVRHHLYPLFLYPLCLSEDDHTLILAGNAVIAVGTMVCGDDLFKGAIVYNWKDKSVREIGVGEASWWYYVESLAC